jgi:hypothetical protein
MKLKLILTTAIVGAALALPSVSSAAPPPPTPSPTQDSVTFTGGPASAGQFEILALDATSGPSGENPSGQADFFFFNQPGIGDIFHMQGPVTCLSVQGSSATINIQGQSQSFIGIVTIQVVDGQPDLFDMPAVLRAPTDCSPAGFSTGLGGPVIPGDIKVVDAQPPPTTMDQCKGEGWKQFGFANQGLCLAFVNRS